MKPDIKNKVCFICGQDDADLVDHVPPKNIFLKKYRNIGENLITVPAHGHCNNEYKLDDEYFRYCILTQAYWASELAREIWNAKYKIEIHNPRKAGFKSYLLSNIKESPFVLPSGEALEEAYLDATRVNRVVARIARGIYYKENDSIMPLSWSFKVQWLELSDKARRTFNSNSSEVHTYGNGIFKYYWYPSSFAFYFLFFDSAFFKVKALKFINS